MGSYTAAIIDKDDNLLLPQTSVASIIDGDSLAKANDLGTTNANISKLVEQVNLINSNNTAWTDWSKEGMALLNGAQQYSEDGDYPRYRTRVINGNKQVQVKFRIKGVTSGGDTAYVSFPSNIKPTGISQLGFSSPSSSGRTASWLIEGENTVKLHATSDNNYNSQFWYPFVGTWEV
ncbi:UNVERIFIED_ORG: hypothetical protein ABIC58_000227 [Leuconostoc holzapfelii]